MTIQPVRSCTNVFDAVLPTLAYDHLRDPDEAHRAIAEARRQAPIALGPHGPEVLSYELVRTVLRDPRFVTATGLGLDVQGITSGPLWDRATQNILGLDGADHHRLRRLGSKARRMPNPAVGGPARWNPMSGITGPAELRIEFTPGH
jgi:cytochrome P450